MYSLQEVELALEHHDSRLSETLYKIERFAYSQGLTELADWSRQELDGYPLGFDVFGERTYRQVSVLWKDLYERIMHIQPDLVLTVSRLPLTISVGDLEGYSDKGIMLKNPRLIQTLNTISQTSIMGAEVAGTEIQSLLRRVRMEARQRLHSALPRVPNRSVVYASPDFANLVPDVDLVRILGQRWNEANSCFEVGAHLATVVLLGSILEGVLLSKVEQNPAQANASRSCPKDATSGRPLPFAAWTLQALIEVGHECGWLKKQYKNFSHVVRDYRNYVHPNKERQEGITFDAKMCRVVFEVVSAALGD